MALTMQVAVVRNPQIDLATDDRSEEQHLLFLERISYELRIFMNCHPFLRATTLG